MTTFIQKTLVLGLIFCFILAGVSLSPIGAAETSSETKTSAGSTEPAAGEDLGYGMASVLGTTLYAPVKITYAGLGLIASGLGFVFSGGSTEVAGDIMNAAVGGDYVVTPSHVKREKPLLFIGPASSAPHQQSSSATPPRS
jgi:hypothetical protein